MPSYLVTGVSRGLGWSFLDQLSANPENTVIGVVRNKASTDEKVAESLKRPNIHILQADITSYDDLKRAADETAAITGGSLDYIIANAAVLPHMDTWDPIGTLDSRDPKAFEDELIENFKINTIANVHIFSLFIPLILRGHTKKVIAISSGASDIDMSRQYDVFFHSPYAISKAALNSVVSKFSAQYRKDGVLFLAVCPGMADTGNAFAPNEEETHKRVEVLFSSFTKINPEFKGPNTIEGAVQNVLSVIEKASLEKGDGGNFVSQFGNKTWL